MKQNIELHDKREAKTIEEKLIFVYQEKKR